MAETTVGERGAIVKRRDKTIGAIAQTQLWAMEPTALRGLASADPAAFAAPAASTTPAVTPLAPSPQPSASLYQKEGSTAIVPVVGMLTKYPNQFDAWCGCVFTLEIQAAIAAALDDESVEQIVLFIDSPGGAAAGTPDLGSFIAQNKSRKPIIAYCSDLCASGAYWLASQCTAIVANPSALIGSIGVYAVLVDQSGAAEKGGCKVYVVSDGQFKGLNEPGLPVDERALGEMQRIVGSIANLFRAAVGEGRSLTPDVVAQLADGRVHIAQEAMALGLIDAIGTFEETMMITKEAPATAAAAANARIKTAVRVADDAGGADAASPDVAEICQKILDGVNALTEAFTTFTKKKDDETTDDAGSDSSSPEDATSKALASDRARLKAISDACPGRADFAMQQYLAGRSADEVKAMVSALDDEVAKFKKQNAATANAVEGIDPVATGGAPGDERNDAESDPEQIWEKNVGGVQQTYRGKKKYFLAAFRGGFVKVAPAK